MNSCFLNIPQNAALAWLQMEKARLLVAITGIALPICLCLSNLGEGFTV